MIRVAAAVIAGEIAWTVPWLALGLALKAAMPGSFEPDGATTSVGILFILVAGSAGCSIIGGWTTAFVARERARLAVRMFAGVQVAIGIAIQAAWWDRLPPWYHLAFLILLVPATLLGGWLRTSGSQVVAA